MPNINAALGCAQLEQLEGFLAKKRAIAERYRAAFETFPGVQWFPEPPFARSNYWLNVIQLDESFARLRDSFLAITNDEKIMTRPTWIPMHRLPMYVVCPKMDLSVTDDMVQRIINLPSSSSLSSSL
jgi:perosamine synthetase